MTHTIAIVFHSSELEPKILSTNLNNFFLSFLNNKSLHELNPLGFEMYLRRPCDSAELTHLSTKLRDLRVCNPKHFKSKPRNRYTPFNAEKCEPLDVVLH